MEIRDFLLEINRKNCLKNGHLLCKASQLLRIHKVHVCLLFLLLTLNDLLYSVMTCAYGLNAVCVQMSLSSVSTCFAYV